MVVYVMGPCCTRGVTRRHEYETCQIGRTRARLRAPADASCVPPQICAADGIRRRDSPSKNITRRVPRTMGEGAGSKFKQPHPAAEARIPEKAPGAQRCLFGRVAATGPDMRSSARGLTVGNPLHAHLRGKGVPYRRAPARSSPLSQLLLSRAGRSTHTARRTLNRFRSARQAHHNRVSGRGLITE